MPERGQSIRVQVAASLAIVRDDVWSWSFVRASAWSLMVSVDRTVDEAADRREFDIPITMSSESTSANDVRRRLMLWSGCELKRVRGDSNGLNSIVAQGRASGSTDEARRHAIRRSEWISWR
jgi:hypothetical protein